MKYIKFLVVGILFGIILVKSEAVSWYRIFEMFKFQSFHMYGIIGTAVSTGIVIVQVFKQSKTNTIEGNKIHIPNKEKSVLRYLIGGSLFGLGWALIGACPGPLFALLGAGVYSILIVIVFAVFGTFLYGIFKAKLPH